MYRAFASLGNFHEVNIVICSPAAVCQALKRQQFLSKKLTRVKDACTLHCEFTLMYLIGRMLWVVQKSITTEFIGSDVWCFTAFPFPVCSIWQFFLFFFPFMQSPNAGDKDDQMLTVGSNYASEHLFLRRVVRQALLWFGMHQHFCELLGFLSPPIPLQS